MIATESIVRVGGGRGFPAMNTFHTISRCCGSEPPGRYAPRPDERGASGDPETALRSLA